MPIPINRASLTTTLEQRYANQSEGGAFNAKTAGTSTLTSVTPQETKFDVTPKYYVNQPYGKTNFKDAVGTTSLQLSAFLKGFSNVKYKS